MNAPKLKITTDPRSILAPPKHLAAESAEFFRTIVKDYGIDDSAGLKLLEEACTALDRATEARKAIEQHGVVIKDRTGGWKANPACAVERDARSQFLHALKQLHLDIEPIRPGPGRPPSSHGK